MSNILLNPFSSMALQCKQLPVAIGPKWDRGALCSQKQSPILFQASPFRRVAHTNREAANSAARCPIGVIDSGVGGLSVLKELRRQLPYENFVYLGDTAHMPYGEKTPTQIQARIQALVAWLQTRHHVKMVVVACNTASVQLSQMFPQGKTPQGVPVVGTVEAICQQVEKVVQDTPPRIGLIATRATVDSGKIAASLQARLGEGATILQQPCQGLASLIEHGQARSQETWALLRSYLKNFRDFPLLVMACTHYPHVRHQIQDLLPKTQLIDPAAAMAQQVTTLLREATLLSPKRSPGSIQAWVTGSCKSFRKTAQCLTSHPLREPLRRTQRTLSHPGKQKG